MRICAFSRVMISHGIQGGMERHLQIIAEKAFSYGHRLTAITTAHPKGLEYEEMPWGSIHYLPSTRSAAYWPNWFEESMKLFIKLHLDNPFDIVLSEGAGADRYAQFKEIFSYPPLVSFMHGTFWGEIENHRRAFANLDTLANTIRYLPPLLHHALFWQSYVKKADKLIAVSPEVKRRIIREFGVECTKIHVIPNGVDTKQFRPSDKSYTQVRDRYSLSKDDKLLLVVNRLTHEKGTHLAIEALNKINKQGCPIKLMIVGDGPDRSRLQRMVELAGLASCVIFCGHIPYEQVPDYLNAADIVLMPTLRAEGFPFALTEAMACGKPIVVSDFNGVIDIITDGIEGMIVPSGDVRALIGATERLLDDNALCSSLGKRARAKAINQFSQDQMTQNTLNVLEHVVSNNTS